jgi:hypothetical protein
MLNLAVSDIDEGAREHHEIGLETGAIVDADKSVRLPLLSDPDGNTIQLVGNFRLKY